jgi:glycogen(starch) synthase
VPRLAILTAAELTRDPRARRQAVAGRRLGFEVVGVSGQISGEPPAPLDGVEVVRVGRVGRANPDWERAASGGRSAVLRELRGLFRLGRLGLRTAALARAARGVDADVVHSNDLETLPAAWLAARGRARLVYDAHELYAEFDSDPPRFYRAVMTAIEGALARRADTVVTVSEPIAAELERRLRLRARPLVVLNAPELDPRESEPAGEGRLRVVYQGAFGRGRPLEELLDAVGRAPSVRLTIRVVRTPSETVLAEVARRGLSDRVEVAAPLSPDRLLDGLRGHEVGVVFDRPVTLNAELSLPNKLFDYLMAGLAVVAPRLPALTPVVEGGRVGMVFEPGRPEALAAALESLAADRDGLAEYRRRARELAKTRYNAEVQAATLAKAWG